MLAFPCHVAGMEKQRRKGSDWIGPLARGVLENCKRAMEARKEASRSLETPGEIEPEPSRREDEAAQGSGIRAEVTRDGRVNGFASGVALIERFPGFGESHMRPLATDAGTYVTEFTVPAKGNAHRIGIGMRLAADARPGDGNCPRARFPADNDDRRDHARTFGLVRTKT